MVTSRSAAIAAYLSAQALSQEAPRTGVNLEAFPEAISSLNLPPAVIANSMGEFSVVGEKEPKWICSLTSADGHGRISVTAESIEIILGSKCRQTLLAPRFYALWTIHENDWRLGIAMVEGISDEDKMILTQYFSRMPKLVDSIKNSLNPGAKALAIQLGWIAPEEQQMPAGIIAALTKPETHTRVAAG